jgi:hypothetical protein
MKIAAASDKVYQLLAHGRWFSPGTPASSTTKTGLHDIVEILLKVAFNTINQIKSNQHTSEDMHERYTCILLHCNEMFPNSKKKNIAYLQMCVDLI